MSSGNMLFPLVICFTSIFSTLPDPGVCLQEAEPEFSPVYLTLSSLYKEPTHSTTLIDREIQVHWTPGSVDEIALFAQPPNPSVEPILQFKTIQYPECFVETDKSFGNPEFPGGWERSDEGMPEPGDHCLSMWVVGYLKGETVHTECLKIRPTWMQDIRLYLENLSLTKAFIPGTHNSGCYKRGETLSYRDTTSGRYILTQDQSIWSQLVYGIRYLDLRVGYYPTSRNKSDQEDCEKCFWVNHDLIKVRPLAPLLAEVKDFLTRTKDEVVFLDLHRFPAGLNGRPARHAQLVRLLQREFASLAFDYDETASPTLGEIWRRGKRIVISYGESTIANEHSWLWPSVRQIWGNKQTVDSLYSFLESVMKNDSLQEPSRGMWAAMAQLTPGPMDLLLKPKGSLRDMAHGVNRNLTNWCRSGWWRRANVLAMDFFLGTDAINTAITANLIKGSKRKQYSIL